MEKEKQTSFEKLVNLLCKTSFEQYADIISILVAIGAICNCCSDKSLPMFWILVIGFAFVIATDIYSIQQVTPFFEHINQRMAGDSELLKQRAKLEKRFYSNKNWIIVFIIPTAIVPSVIYIIQYPLGLPIKIFAYTALYFIISLCVISYSEYVYFILFSYDLYKIAKDIKKYNEERPHKTDWLCELAAVTYKQSNCFFITGLNFIWLLALITFSEQYGVPLNSTIGIFFVAYLWLLVIIGIIVMFTIFSLCSYLFIRLLISGLTDKSINIYETTYKAYTRQKNSKARALIELTRIKILLLEHTPSYPKKPLVCYAVSFVVGAVNFVATLESVYSLYSHFVTTIH